MQVGISAIKFEVARIQFLSDVFVDVAVVVTQAPHLKIKLAGSCQAVLLSYVKMFVSVTREEAITDPLDFSTETFRLDLDVHRIAIFGPVSSDNR